MAACACGLSSTSVWTHTHTRNTSQSLEIVRFFCFQTNFFFRSCLSVSCNWILDGERSTVVVIYARRGLSIKTNEPKQRNSKECVSEWELWEKEIRVWDKNWARLLFFLRPLRDEKIVNISVKCPTNLEQNLVNFELVQVVKLFAIYYYFLYYFRDWDLFGVEIFHERWTFLTQ